MLSQRAQHFCDAPAFLNAAGKAFADPYDANTNPNGYINLGVAENVLPQQLLIDQFSQIRKQHPIDPMDFRYGDFCGSAPLRNALAKLFETKIFKFSHLKANPNHFRITNGAGSCIEMLSACICDEGECILMPTPIYHGLENDLNRRFKSILLPFPMKLVQLDNEFSFRFDLDLEALDKVYEQSIQQGKVIRGLLNINPSNPFGTIFEEAQVMQLMDWCLKRNLHFISDEVYALSIFPSSTTPFVSVMKLIEDHSQKYEQEFPNTKELVHVVYSFSKDFALNGVRAGVLYSQNEQLLMAFNVCGYFTGVSFDTQTLLTKLLQNESFVDHFLRENCLLLEQAAQKSEAVLTRFKVPFVKAQSGMFVFMNLLALSNCEKTEEDEKNLWLHLLEDKKVYVTPGFVFKSPIPGWYRFCISSIAQFEVIEMALERCVEAAKSYHKKSHSLK